MSSFTHLLNTQTHPGKTGVAHLLWILTQSSKHSSHHSLTHKTSRNMQLWSVKLDYVLVDSASFAHVHELPQILSSQWHQLTAMLSMVLYSQGPTQLPHPPIHWRSLWHLYQHTLHNTPTFSLPPTSNCWHCMCSIHSYLRPHQSLPHFGIP